MNLDKKEVVFIVSALVTGISLGSVYQIEMIFQRKALIFAGYFTSVLSGLIFAVSFLQGDAHEQ